MCLFLEVATAWGRFAVGATPLGISRLCFPGPDALKALAVPYDLDKASYAAALGHAQRGVSALHAYVRREDRKLEASMDFMGATPFMRDVFEALMTVPYGSTISYLALADLSGHPGAARAVGGAMKRNRVPILVPCHRVIATGSRLGGWSGPPGFKARLLGHEGIELCRAQT